MTGQARACCQVPPLAGVAVWNPTGLCGGVPRGFPPWHTDMRRAVSPKEKRGSDMEKRELNAEEQAKALDCYVGKTVIECVALIGLLVIALIF